MCIAVTGIFVEGTAEKGACPGNLTGIRARGKKLKSLTKQIARSALLRGVGLRVRGPSECRGSGQREKLSSRHFGFATAVF